MHQERKIIAGLHSEKEPIDSISIAFSVPFVRQTENNNVPGMYNNYAQYGYVDYRVYGPIVVWQMHTAVLLCLYKAISYYFCTTSNVVLLS